MREGFQQIFKDFGETKRVFFSDSCQQSSNSADLSIIKKGISIHTALTQVLILQTDQALPDTDRLAVHYECWLPKLNSNADLLSPLERLSLVE